MEAYLKFQLIITFALAAVPQRNRLGSVRTPGRHTSANATPKLNSKNVGDIAKTVGVYCSYPNNNVPV